MDASPTTVNQQVIDDMTMTNVKVIGGAAANAQAAMYEQRVKHLVFVDSMREKLLSDVVIGKVSVESAIATDKLLASSSQNNFAGLVAQEATGQETAKVANTTPPETGIAQQLANLAATMASVLGILQAQANGPAPVK